ncbi:MAG: elongation factor G, partial [Desulfobacteraceae bacterium]|nr:elongation factor G [Desulfobacteraceae bacterium]
EGMGELHLEVYIERMLREYKSEVIYDKPKVAYRETITQKAEFDYTHKKQTGGSGQYARVSGYIEPFFDDVFEFESKVVGGNIPTQYIPACEKGFKESMNKGPKMGFPVNGVKVVLNDGASHSVDSSDMAFKTASQAAFSNVYPKAKPVIMEPVMKVAVETPSEFQGAAMSLINQRRGMILGSQDEGSLCVIDSYVPLADMFGFSTVLRSATQGKAQYTMEFDTYKQVPKSVEEELIKEAEQEKKKRGV